jgi:hypothetical protein
MFTVVEMLVDEDAIAEGELGINGGLEFSLSAASIGLPDDCLFVGLPAEPVCCGAWSSKLFNMNFTCTHALSRVSPVRMPRISRRDESSCLSTSIDSTFRHKLYTRFQTTSSFPGYSKSSAYYESSK